VNLWEPHGLAWAPCSGNEVLAADLVGRLVFDLASSTGCPHHVHTMLMPMRQTSPLRCAPVSQTPTGEQRSGQRLGADIAAGRADLQESRRLSPGAEVVFGPVGAGGDLVANQHDPRWAYPAGPAASDAPRDAAVCGPSVSHTAAAHEQNAPAHAASGISGSRALGHSRAAPDATLRRDAQPDEQRRLTQGCRSEVLPASARGAEVGAAPPVLPSQGRWAGLATSDAGNLRAMVRSGDHVPSHGSPVQQLATPNEREGDGKRHGSQGTYRTVRHRTLRKPMLYPLSYEGLRRMFAQHVGRDSVRRARAGCLAPDGPCRTCAACRGPPSTSGPDARRRLYG
jgi:hypothetical protein